MSTIIPFEKALKRTSANRVGDHETVIRLLALLRQNTDDEGQKLSEILEVFADCAEEWSRNRHVKMHHFNLFFNLMGDGQVSGMICERTTGQTPEKTEGGSTILWSDK